MIDNLVITHIAFHIIKRKTPDQAANQVHQSDVLLNLDGKSRLTLQDRLVVALAPNSDAVEMIFNPEADPQTFKTCCEILAGQTPAEFHTSSVLLAHLLAASQTHSKIADGPICIIKGTSTGNNRPCLIILKSDYSEALSTEESPGAIAVKYVDKIFLTKDHKLNKIAFICHNNPAAPAERLSLPENIFFKIYDSNVSFGSSQSYATYFYSKFLGLEFRPTDRVLTQRFFSSAKNYFKTRCTDPQDRFEKITYLYKYLSSTQRELVNISTFAREVFPNNQTERNNFKTEISRTVVQNAFPMDTNFIHSTLQHRTFVFDGGGRLRVPSALIDAANVEFDEDDKTLTLVLKGSPVEN